MGGVIAESQGDNFGQGFAQGASTAAIGFMCNDSLNKIEQYLRRVFEGSRTGGGTGFQGKIRVLSMKFEYGLHDIQGHRVGLNGMEEFYEEKASAYFQVWKYKFGYERINGQVSKTFYFGPTSVSNSGLKIEFGGTLPAPSGAAINGELIINVGEIFNFK